MGKSIYLTSEGIELLLIMVSQIDPSDIDITHINNIERKLSKGE